LNRTAYGTFCSGCFLPEKEYDDIKGLARSLLHQQVGILGSARSQKSRKTGTASIGGPSDTEFQDEWDLFICHASEDKDSCARPLAEALRARGLRVWYDEFALKVGDSLRRSIDRGLSRSRFGVVVLSHAFFQKNWPQYELDGLAQRETEGPKVILPVWHRINEPEVRKYSPSLAGRVAALATDGMNSVVEKLLDAVGVPLQSEGTLTKGSEEQMTMQVLGAVFSRDYNGFILIVEFRRASRESGQLT